VPKSFQKNKPKYTFSKGFVLITDIGSRKRRLEGSDTLMISEDGIEQYLRIAKKFFMVEYEYLL